MQCQVGYNNLIILCETVNFAKCFFFAIFVQNVSFLAPIIIVQKLDSAIHWINLYPVDNAIGFPNTYPLDSDLSSG